VPRQDEFTALEAEAARALRVATEPFARRARLVDRLESAASRAPTADQRGRLALQWLRSVGWLWASVPFRAAEQPPYQAWLADHEAFVIYSEPSGAWMVSPEVAWKVHGMHRSAANADEIAWFVVMNGYPGECEGYVPCYANVFNWLDGEYLRRHPRGRHVAEAVEQVRSRLEEAGTTLSGPSASDFLNPASDCDDLRAGLTPLRSALLGSTAGSRTDAIAVVDRLLSYCP
jgi:hypothetical protein